MGSPYEDKTIKQFFDGFGEGAVNGNGEERNLAEEEVTFISRTVWCFLDPNAKNGKSGKEFS